MARRGYAAPPARAAAASASSTSSRLIPTRPVRVAAASDGVGRMSLWRKRLFVLMTRNARSATAFFGLPPNRVVELGAQIQF